MQKKVILICPYFGKLPEHIDLWFESCKKNKSYDFLLICDSNIDIKNSNIKLVKTSFDELKKRIQEKFDFLISLESPYKLCDFRPCFGDIFIEQIKEYEYWGYCDISDVIFGNLEKFITPLLDGKNEKIGNNGHLTIFKNNLEINERYKLCNHTITPYQKVFSNNTHYSFDENNKIGINWLYKKNNYKYHCISDVIDDISPIYYPFRLVKQDNNENRYYDSKYPIIYEYNNGSLFRVSLKKREIVYKEVCYLHFQKREMKLDENIDINHYLITPLGFIKYQNIDEGFFKKVCINKPLYKKYFILKYRNLLIRLRKILYKEYY